MYFHDNNNIDLPVGNRNNQKESYTILSTNNNKCVIILALKMTQPHTSGQMLIIHTMNKQ